MSPRLCRVLSPWLAALIGVAGFFCLIRWAECPDYDSACFFTGEGSHD